MKENTHPSVLLVEDEPGHAVLIRRAFKAHETPFQLEIAVNLQQARAHLAESRPDLVITDLMLPDGSGIELLETGEKESDYPIVVLTSQGDEKVAVEAMKAGALDYVVKSSTTLEAMPRIAERVLREWGHIAQRRQTEKALAIRLRYEEALARCSRALLTDKPNAFTDAVTPLLKASGTGRACVYENVEDPIEGLCMHRILEIHTPDAAPLPDTSPMKYIPYKNGFQRWEKMLAAGESIKGAARDFPGEERFILDRQEVASILALPVTVKNRWYGFVSFSDPRSIGRWNRDCIGILQTAAEMIGAYLGLKQTEKMLVDARDTLEHRVTERTAELKKANEELSRDIAKRKRAEAALKKAIQMTESANQAKNEFVANMSHEIRTPMNGIIGMTWLLEETRLTPQQRNYTETIRESGNSLLTIINDILDFSKIEAGKLQMEILDFDLRTTLRDLVDLLGARVKERDLALVSHIDHDVYARLQGDPGRLRQVLTNLIGNAVKFTKEGKISLDVSLESETRTRVVIRFTVSDTGIGIPKDRLANLFDKFTQVDTSMSREYGGTGLGLAISKQICELMGGRIGVESEVGKGSTFWFTAEFKKKPLLKKPKGPASAKALRGKRILVVDADSESRMVLRSQLQSWKCRYDVVVDGPSALKLMREEAAKSDPFAVAILDMPVMGIDLEELVKTIKGDPLLKATKMVLMAAFGKRGDAAHTRDIGFSAYLTRPVSAGELFECLTMVIRRDREGEDGGEGSIVTRHTIAETKRQNVHILLAEDNRINRRMALEILKKLGYRATAVENGKEAVRELGNHTFDLVLMDIQMPELDGLEATRIIRCFDSTVRNYNIPIIAMTANTMKGDREKCLDAGMNDYVGKPIRPEELVTAIENQLTPTPVS